MTRPRLTRYDLLCLLILAVLPGLFFWRLLTPHEADRQQILNGDFTEQYYPLRAFTAQAWSQGHLPLWNPALYGGQPALADIQSGALYPPHVLQALLLSWGSTLLFGNDIGFPLRALAWQVVCHFSLASMGSYLFFHHHAQPQAPRVSRLGAVAAALTFTYSGYLTGFPVQQLTILETAVWLPWLLWALEHTHWRWGSLILALALLAGHPQTVLYISYMAIGYALFLARPTSLPQLLKPGLRLSLTFVVGLGLAAPQILPTLEFINLSLRANLSYEAVSAGLPLTELVAIIYPGYLGGSPQYIGIIGLILLLYALMFGSPRSEILFWAGIAGLSLLLALGKHSFLYNLFYLFAPGFDQVRQQERVLLLYAFSASMLVGYGAMALMQPISQSQRAMKDYFDNYIRVAIKLSGLLLIVFIYGSTHLAAQGQGDNLFVGVLRHHVFLMFMLAWFYFLLTLRQKRRLRRWWGQGVLLGGIAFNLWTINWQFNLAKPTPVFPATGTVQFLQTHTTHERIVTGGLLAGGNNAASIHHLNDLTGNTPLQLASVEKFLTQLPSWRMWQLMHVRYVLANRNIGDAGLKEVLQEGEQRVFEMADPFPLAWFVSQTEVMTDSLMALNRLSEDNFDLRHMALLRQALPLLLTPDPQAAVTIQEINATQWQFMVTTTTPQLLVLSHVYYPGWQATLDGQPLTLWQTNEVQVGVLVPPGQHQLTLFFQPSSFWWGVMVAVGCGLMGVWGGVYNIIVKR